MRKSAASAENQPYSWAVNGHFSTGFYTHILYFFLDSRSETCTIKLVINPKLAPEAPELMQATMPALCTVVAHTSDAQCGLNIIQTFLPKDVSNVQNNSAKSCDDVYCLDCCGPC